MSGRSAASAGYVAELDGLRGVAILLVMVHRMYPRTQSVPWPIEAGWAGVDLFFVISGFLIAGILIDTRGEPDYFRNFYARRVLRIFPLFYLFIGGMLLAFPLARHDEFLRQAGSPLWYLLQLGNVPEALLGRDPPYWLAPVWSLAIEEQFYLTFPLLVRWAAPQRLARWLGAIAVLALATRIATTELAPDRERVQYLFTLCRLDTIALGCLLAVFVRSPRYPAWRARLPGVLGAVIAAAAAVLATTQFDRTTWFGRTFGYDVLALGLAALVLWVFHARGGAATAVLRSAVLRYPGKLCFGLYLLHRPADTLVTALAARADLDETSLAWLPVKIGVALVLATASWRVIELPFLRRKQRFASHAHPLVVPTAAITTLVVVLAGCRSPARAAPADAPVQVRDACTPARDGELTVPDAPAMTDAGAVRDAPVGEVAAGDAAIGTIKDAMIDAAMPDARPPDASPPAPGRVLYPEGRLHSPITDDIAAALSTFAAHTSAAEPVFGKVGDSITASASFLTCFDGGAALGDHAALAETLGYFRAGDAAGATPFARVSLAAQGGWTTADLLAGDPPPLDRELTAIAPRYALVMLGTNDARFGRTADAFGADLWTVVERARRAGAIPILSTLPAMHGDPGGNAQIGVFNRVIRAIAQGCALPLVDLHLALSALPDDGIGPDGIHPTAAPEGACVLSDAGLHYGYNLRNLVSLEALDRARRARRGETLDASAQRRAGSGTHADPFRAELPIADMADTRAGDAGLAHYAGCALAAPGREVVYRLDLPAAVTIDAYVIDRDPVDVDVAILAGSLDESACVAAGDHAASARVGPGAVFVVIDSRTTASEGEFAVVVQGSG